MYLCKVSKTIIFYSCLIIILSPQIKTISPMFTPFPPYLCQWHNGEASNQYLHLVLFTCSVSSGHPPHMPSVWISLRVGVQSRRESSREGKGDVKKPELRSIVRLKWETRRDFGDMHGHTCMSLRTCQPWWLYLLWRDTDGNGVRKREFILM